MHDHTAHLVLQTVAIALSAGVLLIAAAKRAGAPSILWLLVGGVVQGPVGLGLVLPETLGSGLRVMVSLLVGIILFEGGLTLDLEGYRRGSRTIHRLLTIGATITWLGTSLALWALTDFDVTYCLVIGSLVIVTGPTVIGPLLKRVRVSPRIHHILQWEGVLVDPVGVFVALLCFEALALGRAEGALVDLALRVGGGLAVGLLGGAALSQALRRGWIPTEMHGSGTLACAVAIFATAEAATAEAGLLAVTVAGLVVGWRHPVDLSSIRHFKGEVTELSIGVLFIVLSARLDPRQFLMLGVPGLAVVALLIVLVRPAAVMTSTLGSGLSLRERTFLSWIGPRGIVAASMASLFAIELEALGAARPRFVESFTFAVIIATILLQGSSAKMVARWLGVLAPQTSGWMVVGAHGFGRAFAKLLRAQGTTVLLVDTNAARVEAARADGLDAIHADAFDVERLRREPAMADVNNVLAATANAELNRQLAAAWRSTFGADHTHADWPGEATLPRPATMAHELERGLTRLVLGPRPSEDAIALATLNEAGMTSPGITAGGASFDEGAETLWLVREGSLFADALEVELELEVTSDDGGSTGVVQQLLSAPETEAALSPEVRAAAMRALEQRDAAVGTLLGGGLALPHLFLAELDRPRCLLARLSRPTTWVEGEPPVTRVILLLSPAHDEPTHLALLADLARHHLPDNKSVDPRTAA